MSAEVIGVPQPWYESQFESAQLSLKDDREWLSALANKDITPANIEAGNDLMALGSISLRGDTDPVLVQQVIQAREAFYGQILGWDDPGHPLSNAYEAMKTQAIRTMPLATVVGSQRVVSAAGIDVVRLLASNPVSLNYGPESVKLKLENLTQLGLDAPTMINRYPALVSLAPESVRFKMRIIDRLLQTLGASFTAHELVNDSPVVLGSSVSKLFTTARFAAAHGSADTLPDIPKTAVRMLFLPVHSHLLAVASDTPYSAATVQKTSRQVPASERRPKALELLSDETQRQKIGEKCVRAYLRNAPLKPHERAKE
jgi:hypothetical protein